MTVSPEFVAATADAFEATVKRTYGSTEAPNVTTSTWNDSPERARETDGRAVGPGRAAHRRSRHRASTGHRRCRASSSCAVPNCSVATQIRAQTVGGDAA